MAKHIVPAYRSSGAPPLVMERTLGAAAAFAIGDAVTQTDGAGTIAAHALGATVTNIYGFSAESATAGASLGPNSTKALVFKAVDDQFWWGKLINAGTVQVPAAANIGVRYGLIVVSGVTYVDEADTVDVVVEITDIDLENDGVIFKIISTARQEG